MHENDYLFDESNSSEQYNTLLMLDAAFEKNKTGIRPVFHLLGGTALLFHGVTAVATIDIDTANRLSNSVRRIVEPFVSDNASEVAVLASNYTKRLVPYKEDIFVHIKVYILSIEDLVITKLGAGRVKDIEDLTRTDILQRCDFCKLYTIMKEELPCDTCSKLMEKLAMLDPN